MINHLPSIWLEATGTGDKLELLLGNLLNKLAVMEVSAGRFQHSQLCGAALAQDDLNQLQWQEAGGRRLGISGQPA